MTVSMNHRTSPFTCLPRKVLEAIIDAALAELDARDGDPDIEDEPETEVARFAARWAGTPEDEEDNHDQEEDPAENEAWEQPNWNVSAALTPPTNLFAHHFQGVRHG